MEVRTVSNLSRSDDLSFGRVCDRHPRLQLLAIAYEKPEIALRAEYGIRSIPLALAI